MCSLLSCFSNLKSYQEKCHEKSIHFYKLYLQVLYNARQDMIHTIS